MIIIIIMTTLTIFTPYCRLSVILVLADLLNLTLAHNDNLQDCSKRLFVEATFDTRLMGDPHNFDSFRKTKSDFSSLPWPDNDLITFTLETRRSLKPTQTPSIKSNNTTVLIQLALKPFEVMSPEPFLTSYDPAKANASSGKVEDQLFNCFMDRSEDNLCEKARHNPRCCYDSRAQLHELHKIYPACDSPCTQPCDAICYQAMVLQVEFERLQEQEDIPAKTSFSMVGRQIRLSQQQRQGPFQVHEMRNRSFSDVVSVDLEPKYYVSRSHAFESLVNDKVATGYWLRWRPQRDDLGPTLEVGREGSEVPYFIHDFQEECMDCLHGDNFSWRASDVQLPRLVSTFRPKFWAANAHFGGEDVIVGVNCTSLIVNDFQNQFNLGGICISDDQCRRWCSSEEKEPHCLNRKCLLETQSVLLPHSVQRRTCQLPAGPNVPLEYILVFFGAGLDFVLFVIWGALACYYAGSLNPRKKRAQLRSTPQSMISPPVEAAE